MRLSKSQLSLSRSSILAIAVIVAGGASCTSILGIGGDFTVDSSNGGSTSSSGSTTTSGATMGGGGAGGAGGVNPSSSSSSSTGGIIYPETGDITGKWLTYQVALNGDLTANRPTQFATAANQPTIYFYDKATKKFSHGYSPTTASNSGTFTVKGTMSDPLPDGAYLAVFPSHVAYWLKNRDVDYSNYQTAAFRTPLPQPGPQINLTVTNMTPWNANTTGNDDVDVLELIDPASAAYAFDQNNYALGPRWAAGVSTFTASGDWVTEVFGVKTPVALNDTVAFFHVGTAPGQVYQTLIDYATTSFVTPNGTDTFDVTVNFMPVNPTTFDTHELNVDLAANEAQTKLLNPRAQYLVTNVDYAANANPIAYGQLMGTADLAFKNFQKGTAQAEADITYTYGSPFEAWSVYLSIGGQVTLDTQIPGTAPWTRTEPLASSCLLPADDPRVNRNSALIKPFDAPPSGVKVDGASIFNNGVPIAIKSTTPTLSWDPPAIPKQAWSVEIFQASTSPDCRYSVSCDGIACGNINDGCGNIMNCGTCAGTDVCVYNTCVDPSNTCGNDPTLCADNAINCGQLDDGCGHLVDCGSCSGSDVCGGSVYGQCSPPQTLLGGIIGTVEVDGDATSVTIPPNVMAKGGYYLFQLMGTSSMKGVTYEATPNRTMPNGADSGNPSIPVCYTNVISDLIQIAN